MFTNPVHLQYCTCIILNSTFTRVSLLSIQYYSSINEAITDSNNGDRIIVHPGVYNEVISLSKEVTIIGAGPENVLLVNSSNTVIEVDKAAKSVTLCNMEVKVCA